MGHNDCHGIAVGKKFTSHLVRRHYPHLYTDRVGDGTRRNMEQNVKKGRGDLNEWDVGVRSGVRWMMVG